MHIYVTNILRNIYFPVFLLLAYFKIKQSMLIDPRMYPRGSVRIHAIACALPYMWMEFWLNRLFSFFSEENLSQSNIEQYKMYCRDSAKRPTFEMFSPRLFFFSNFSNFSRSEASPRGMCHILGIEQEQKMLFSLTLNSNNVREISCTIFHKRHTIMYNIFDMHGYGTTESW